MTGLFLLHPPADVVDHDVAQPHDVEGVDHHLGRLETADESVVIGLYATNWGRRLRSLAAG